MTDDFDDFVLDDDCLEFCPPSPSIARCRCNNSMPCDTFHECNSRRKPITKCLTDESDDLLLAESIVRDAYTYHRLENHCLPTENTNTKNYTLADLRAACVHDLSPYATDEEAELFYRVHSLLDWDQRNSLIAELDSLQRFDDNDIHQDCFSTASTITESVLYKWIYSLCCPDNEIHKGLECFSLYCLCHLDGICLNPQHYVHKVRQPRRKLIKRSRKRCFRGKLVVDEEDDARVLADDFTDAFRRSNTPTSKAAPAKPQINLLNHTEMCAAEEEAERQRQFAIAACIDDQFQLDRKWREMQERLLKEQREIELDIANTGCGSDDDSFLTLEDIMGEDECSEDTGNMTPQMQSYANACATPISTSDVRHCKPLVIPNLPILPDIGVCAKKSQSLAKNCKKVASMFEMAMTAWHFPKIVL